MEYGLFLAVIVALAIWGGLGLLGRRTSSPAAPEGDNNVDAQPGRFIDVSAISAYEEQQADSNSIGSGSSKPSTQILSDKELLDKIRGMSPYGFEKYIALMFESFGYQATVTPSQNDGGVDVVIVKKERRGFVQCKKYIEKQVSLSEIRDFYGAIVDELEDIAYFVTTNVFTLQARDFAVSRPRDKLRLIDGKRLIYCIRLLERSDKPLPLPEDDYSSLKSCPECTSGWMVRRRNKRNGNSFWGCSNYPTCQYAVSYITD